MHFLSLSQLQIRNLQIQINKANENISSDGLGESADLNKIYQDIEDFIKTWATDED